MRAMYNNQNNGMINLNRINVQNEDESEVYEVPPVNDIAP